MDNKRAFEIQFNWIFILVAGAAILLFFTFVISKQKGLSEISTRATVLKSIEAIIVGTSVSTDTTNVINIPNSNIEVECNRVAISEVSKQYQHLILFSPSLIKGDKLLTQTSTFSAPFKATNILYVTSPQVAYIIITNTNNNLAKDVNRSLSTDLTKEFHETIPKIESANNYKVKFVIFGNTNINSIDLKKIDRMPDSDVTAVKINGDLNKGEIEFYQKDKSAWMSKGKSYYITKPSILGAIYSDTLDSYECNARNIFSRLKLVTEVYIRRSEELKRLSVMQECIGLYTSALSYLRDINKTSSDIIATKNIEQGNIDSIFSSSKLLYDKNNEARKYSCPLIY